MNYLKFLLPFFLISCGIIKTHKEYITIDSSPRGLEVLRQVEGKKEVKKIGMTPMYLEVPKGAEDRYTFKDPNNKKYSVKSTPKNTCRLFLEGEGFATKDEAEKKGVSLSQFAESWAPQNLLKGSNFECIRMVRAELKKSTILKNKKICRTYLIMPPRSSYQKVSVDLANAWIDQVFKKKKKKCDKVITPLVAEEHLLFLGISELKGPQDITELDYQKFIDLGAKFKATDVVFLPYTQKDKTFTVTPKIYDIHKGVKGPGTLAQKYTKNLDVSGGYKFSNTLFSLFRFIPNGIAAQGKFQNKLHGYGDAGSFKHVYDDFSFSVAFNNLQYPQYKWKSQTRIVPQLVWQDWGEDLSMDLYGLIFDYKWFFHLPPGGVAVLRGGLGGTYIYAKWDEKNYRRSVGTLIADLGAEFYFFPWERIYLLFGYRRYFIPKVIKGPEYAVTGESRFFLNIGYFWPEMRTAARRWIKI